MIEEDEFKKIFKEHSVEQKWDGDNAYQGLQIIAKYLSPLKHTLITAAEHDCIYSVSVWDLCEAGITKEDVLELLRLNWSIEIDYLYCFV